MKIALYLLIILQAMIFVNTFTIPNLKRNKLFQSNIKLLSSTITSNSNRIVNYKETGAFKLYLPDIYPSKTHYKRALKKLKEVKIDSTIKNIRNQNRKFTAQSLDTLMKALTVPITESVTAYEEILKKLHPFEQTVAELTITARVKKGYSSLDILLDNVKLLRSTTSKLAKEYASKANNATTSLEAKELLIEGMNKLQDLYEKSQIATSLDELVELQKDLRKIPIIELKTPTVVLVGAPNVGKSSIVRSVSSGTPEVNDYPFTTRGVTIGHIVDINKDIRFQVMDTPGLLDRPAEERNEMEKLTFASLLHLPTAVIYVIDPSGLSGEKSTLQAQLNVRNILKQRFPKRPWIDVVSKGDLDLDNNVLKLLPENYLLISVKNGFNIEILKKNIETMCLSLQAILTQQNK